MPEAVYESKPEKGDEGREQPSLSVPITELGLRARGRSVLLGVGMKTVGDVLAGLEKGDQVLTDPQVFAPELLIDLKRQLRRRGYTIPGEPTPTSSAAAKMSITDRLKAAMAAASERRAKQAKPPREKKPRREKQPRPKRKLLPEVEPHGEVVQPAPPAQARLELAKSRLEAATQRPDVAEPAPKVAKAAKPRPEKAAPRVGAEWVKKTFARAAKGFRSGGWFYGVIGAFAVIGLLLPPLSLGMRLADLSGKPLRADKPTVRHDAGLTLEVDDDFTGDLRVDLDVVSEQDFLQGRGGAAIAQAMAALPDHITVKSPIFLMDVSGEPAEPVTIEVDIPTGAEPWETLDLYTWTGQSWEFIPSELTGEFNAEVLTTKLALLPSSLVVAQTGPVTPTVTSLLSQGDAAAGPAAEVVDQLNPVGLILGVQGGFGGDAADLPLPEASGDWAVLPSLRNWAPGTSVNWGLVSDLANVASDGQAHIDNILQLCSDNGFAGIELDYRGLGTEDAEAYAEFIESLADALHAEGLLLSVVFDPPTETDMGWDAGGYDWASIGAHADVVKARFPEDPDFFSDQAAVQQLLDWATARVHRHKLLMLVPSLSLELAEGSITGVPLEDALSPFGTVVSLDGTDRYEPGEEVHLGLPGSVLATTPQEALGTYSIDYEVAAGESRTVWLGTGENLAAKLAWAEKYHLGGVALVGLLSPGNAETVAVVLDQYSQQALPTAVTFPPEGIAVAWAVDTGASVVGQATTALTLPEYTWTAPEEAGTYTVSAAIAGFDHGLLVLTAGSTWTAEEAECLEAKYVADVTVPDGTAFDPGEAFEKIWRLENSGECDWPRDTVLVFDSGSQMGGPDSVPVGAVEVGDTVDISVELVAPETDGRYTGVWRLMIGDIEIPGGGVSIIVQSGEATAPPPAAVVGGVFELGGHVKDGGHPYSDAMHYSGMNWSKVQVHYAGDASPLIQMAHSRGFRIQLSALGGPGMVTQPNFEQDFANWTASLAAAGADAIEVWNEPNINREWAEGSISPVAYTQLLCACYSAIKAANPSTMVISAAPAPTGWFGGGCTPAGCDDLPWIQGLYNSGAAQCMDYIGAHHNAGATSPSARTGHPADPGQGHHSWYFLPQTELYFNSFGRTRRLFYTEMGYASQEGLETFSDAFWWARNTNNAQQAAWLAEAVSLSVNTGMVRVIIVWNIDFTRSGADPQDGYAIIRPGGACPACDSLHALLGSR